MTIDFNELLSTDQKRNLLQQRIAQFAAEGYQHTLNKQVGESTNNEDLVQKSDEALTILSSAIETHQAELDALPEE